MKFTFGMMMAMLVVLGLVCSALAEDCSKYGKSSQFECQACCRRKGMMYKANRHALRMGCKCKASDEPSNIYVPGRDD